MITEKDKHQIALLGITPASIERQLELLKHGVPQQIIDRAAVKGDGIIILTPQEKHHYQERWKKWNETNRQNVQSMVPASGAATRMFKKLYEYIDGAIDEKDAEMQLFFNQIKEFAFYETLNTQCKNQTGSNVEELIKKGDGKAVCKRLLFEDGLSYGLLPKGLLYFHKAPQGVVHTPIAEHLLEACYFRGNEKDPTQVHFSVSQSAKGLFEKHIEDLKANDPQLKEYPLAVSLSVQKPSTDTVAIDKQGELLRGEDGQIVFRPGGHGALIENLNDLHGNIVFIRNIDNVMPISKMESAMEERGALAGFLLAKREQIFNLQHRLDNKLPFSEEEESEYCLLLQELNIPPITFNEKHRQELQDLLHRPIRVCGMVKNQGEAGGGPYWVRRHEGSVLQILEKAQVDLTNLNQQQKFEEATHFNPVDIVCSLEDYKGASFNLLQYVDHTQAFLVKKTTKGQSITALELPGLWNGAMSGWITFFVEIPLALFNPVKTVNDLLRSNHKSY